MENNNITVAQAMASIEAATNNIADSATQRYYQLHPELMQSHGQKGLKQTFEDYVYHLEFIIAAIGNKSPQSFVESVRWTQNILKSRHVPVDMVHTLELLGQEIRQSLGEEVWVYV